VDRCRRIRTREHIVTKHSAPVVGISALGGIASLADLSIGGNIGTTNALFGVAGPARIDPGRRAPRPSS
jgi:hypothetical protein